MPCYDPILSRREERLIKVLELIIDFKFLGEEIEYPDGFNGDISDCLMHGGSDKFLNPATKILCDFCKRKGEDFIYNGRFKERRRLADWWDEHKMIDRFWKD